MKISVQSKLPAGGHEKLVAAIDPGENRRLFKMETAKGFDGWRDVTRRQKQGELKKGYLGAGEQPVLFLPGAVARQWGEGDNLRVLGARALDAAADRDADELIVLLDSDAGAQALPLIAEGLGLRAYRFDKYKHGGKKKPGKPEQVTLIVGEKHLTEARRIVREKLRIMESVDGARDLVNEPGSVATPAMIETLARAVARKAGLKITVLQAAELQKQGYEGLLTVGHASPVPPRMVILRHDPAASAGKGSGGRRRAAQAGGVHLGLLGKGVTFDTGGVSLKPSKGMWEMKGDMAGAAATLYAMEAIARAKVKLPVTGILCLAHNAIDGTAVLPGDIFTAKNGKTVHVDNTDAEGRLILTDGMWRMGEEKVTHLVDMATLTGAAARALGPALSALFSNDPLGERVRRAGDQSGEPCWPLPLVEAYREWLDHDMADLNNVSSKAGAGATTAALFLREFVPEGVEWVHLDIAGSFLVDSNFKYYRPGATGVMVRTMLTLAEELAG